MRRALFALVFLAASCAAPRPAPDPPSLRPAFDRLLVGKSTKAEVRAALGDATVVDFDSGYEVWVYREARKERRTEFVLLFAPSGILIKKREKELPAG
jgi:hypothetical protein